MITMTVATDALGNVLGAIQHPADKANGDFQAGVHFGPGAVLREIEVPAELSMERVHDVAKFHDALRQHAIGAKH